MKISPSELSEIASIIHEKCGIILDSSKGYLVESRLEHFFLESPHVTYGDLCRKSRENEGVQNSVSVTKS